MNDKLYIKGWAQAFFAVLVILALNQVAGRWAIKIFDVNPVIYSCAAFSSCALLLLVAAGPGVLGRETMRSLDTWVYGIILMLGYIIGMFLWVFVTSTEGTMLQKVSIVISLCASWFFLSRQPDRYQLLGMVLVAIGVVVVFLGLDAAIKGPVFLLALTYGGLQAARIFTAELHRPHAEAFRQQADPKARLRVVGFVMFVISVLFLFLSLIIAIAQSFQAQPLIDTFPTLDSFVYAPSIFGGLLHGLVLVAPLRILEFNSSHIIKAENFTAVTSLTFVGTLFWEWVSAPLTGLSLVSISGQDIVAGVLITIGGLVTAYSQIQSSRHASKASQKLWDRFLGYQAQNPAVVEASHELAGASIAHFQGDVQAAAAALAIPPQVLQVLGGDRDRVLGFKPEVLSDIERRYRQKISSSDALTQLPNRASFLSELRRLISENVGCQVFFIDLNDFKPINDRLGHEAGDQVLEKIGQRLGRFASPKYFAARLGGDEFCLIVRAEGKSDPAQSMLATLGGVIEKPIVIELDDSEQEVQVHASIGLARFPEDASDAESLLASADKAMYREKDQLKSTGR